MLLFLLILKVNSYLDGNKIKYAVDAGNEYYYKDRQKILYRYDQNFKGGQSIQSFFKLTQDQSHHLIPLQYLDYQIFQTSRTITNDQDYFSYSITMRLSGNYTLILCFIESEQRSARFFDIYIEQYLIKKQFDIYKEAGGLNIPLYYTFEFEFDGKNITINNNETIYQMEENKIHFDIIFKGKGASISAIILYNGKIEDIITDLESALLSKDQIEATFINQIEFIKVLRQKSERYAKKQRNKGNENVQNLMNQYLSPFQKIINNYDIGPQISLETQHIFESSLIEIIFDSIIYFIFGPLGNILILIFEIILSNKIISIILIINILLYYYCFSLQKPQQINIPINFNLDEVEFELDFTTTANSPKSRNVNVLKSKKKKK